MREKIIEYLIRHSPFSVRECEDLADKIHTYDSLSTIQDTLMSYLGGYDEYAYETCYELAEGIKNL